jgi:subtilisin family serine protease
VLPARLTAVVAALCGFLLGPAALAAPAPPQQTWHGRQIHLYDAQRAGFTGRGVVVAVLDGWIDTTHPDFGGRLRAGADCTSGTCTPTMGRDNCGQEHGTHVAGTVTSSSYGVADRATLMPVRVLTADSKGECTGNPSAVAAGVRWAVANGARVLNLSLGPDIPGAATTSALPAAVHEAAMAGAVVVFSAGNNDLPVAQAYGSDALVVAATGPTGQLASYTQRDAGVSVAAPGGDPPNAVCATNKSDCVTSLYPGNQYAVAAGTSMAAPHVAGIAALLLAAHPSWTAAQVRDRITGTAHPLAHAGAGLVDAAAALGAPVGTPTHAPTPRATTPVRARATTPARTTTRPPTHAPKATPTPTPVQAATPQPLPPQPSPTPSATPVVVAAPPPTDPDSIPLPLAAVAGLFVGLAGAAVLVLPRLA